MTGKERGSLAVEAWSLLVTVTTELGIVVGTEARSDWYEELLRGEDVENACWEASRRRLSIFKERKGSWTWREGSVRSR